MKIYKYFWIDNNPSLLRDKGMLLRDKGMLLRNKGMLFGNKGMLFGNKVGLLLLGGYISICQIAISSQRLL